MKKQMLYNKEGWLLFKDKLERGIFSFYAEGKTKRGYDYSYLRLHDVGFTKGSEGRPARKYWRRRYVTDYDKKKNNTVTNHIDIIPELIPELIKMLAVAYEDITGGKIKTTDPKEMKRDVVKKKKTSDEEEKLLDKIGGML